MIQVQIEQWQQLKAKLSRLQQQVNVLRKQNKYLKKRLQQGEQSDKENYKFSKSDFSDNQYSQKSYDLYEDRIREDQTYRNGLDNSLKACSSIDMSSVSDQSYDIRKNQREQKKVQNSSDQIQQSGIRVSRKNEESRDIKSIFTKGKHNKISSSELPFIQDICVYGPNIENITDVTFKTDNKQLVEPKLYYPQDSKQYKQYGNYFFPHKVRIKPTQPSKHAVQANKIIFKNTKKQQTSIFIFQGNEAHPLKHPNEVFNKVNPSKWLYGLVIEFPDFITKTTHQNYQDYTSTAIINDHTHKQDPLKGSLLNIDIEDLNKRKHKMETASLKDIQFLNEYQHMYRSNFCLCIFTYFPFITFLQDLIWNLFDEVKLKRIENFPKTRQYKNSDVFYFIEELKNSIQRIKTHFLAHPLRINTSVSLKFHETLLKLNLSEQTFYKELYGGWAYQMLKIIDRDTLYQLYCLLMLQNSLYFVCQDNKTLTFMIMLFAAMLTQPFGYPYPVVSVIFSEQLLQTPFTSIIGINQSPQWVQKAERQHILDLDNKHIVIITESQVKIRRNFRYTPPRSDNLKKIFNKLYKKPETFSLTNILLKKESTSQTEIAKQETNNFLNFFYSLQRFYQTNIFSYMPQKMTISELGQEMNVQQNKPEVRNSLLDHIESFYKKSNPNYVKDEFIKEFMQTEIFSICLMEEYQIQ